MKKPIPLLLLASLVLTGCKNTLEPTENTTSTRKSDYDLITDSSETAPQLSLVFEKNSTNMFAGSIFISNSSEENIDIILSDTEELYLQEQQWQPIFMGKSAIYLLTTIQPGESYQNNFDFSEASTSQAFTPETQFKLIFHFKSPSNQKGFQKEIEFQLK